MLGWHQHSLGTQRGCTSLCRGSLDLAPWGQGRDAPRSAGIGLVPPWGSYQRLPGAPAAPRYGAAAPPVPRPRPPRQQGVPQDTHLGVRTGAPNPGYTTERLLQGGCTGAEHTPSYKWGVHGLPPFFPLEQPRVLPPPPELWDHQPQFCMCRMSPWG